MEVQEQRSGKVGTEEKTGEEVRDSMEQKGKGRPKKIENSKEKEVEAMKNSWRKGQRRKRKRSRKDAS